MNVILTMWNWFDGKKTVIATVLLMIAVGLTRLWLEFGNSNRGGSINWCKR